LYIWGKQKFKPMENSKELSEQELKTKKEEMFQFYKESMPYLEAQLDYETRLSEIDEMRLKRTHIQMQYAQIMTPLEEEDHMSEEGPMPNEMPKKRKLKTEA
jgi:hypothetical protein